MKRIAFISALLISLTLIGSAQDYKTAAGLRFGLSNGITLKHFLGEKAAVEGIFAYRWKGFEITGLYELHNQGLGIEGLTWFYGLGAHVGLWNGSDVPWASDTNAYTVIGVDGILGFDYKFADFPINVSLDWKPAFNIVGYTGLWLDGGALSIRYTF
jgi:hypothetical protein